MSEREFRVTEDHLKLLRHAYVSYDDYSEYGAPSIDPKRPYGNSNVVTDIIEILTGQAPDEDNMTPREYDKLIDDPYWDKVHKETATALQIVLRTGLFEPGLYSCPLYSNEWVRVDLTEKTRPEHPIRGLSRL